ncbi:MAG: nicotinate phosphoribosyltransferase [Acetobacteraceae bacterium]
MRATLSAADVPGWTDVYFNRTENIVVAQGDMQVTYAFFIRRPVLAALGPMLECLEKVTAEKGVKVDVALPFREGAWVGAGEPIAFLTGPFSQLASLETILLQKLGSCCVAAYNAYQMAVSMPRTPFLAMDARHCTGPEMQIMMAYAAAVGSRAANQEGAVGFVNSANDVTAFLFGKAHGAGTMPHALVGYAGSTIRAAEIYHDRYPQEKMTVLVDYFAQEVTDTIALCQRFPRLAEKGDFSIRLDTHGGRFLEGLDTQKSYAILEKHVPGVTRRYRSEAELRYLIGSGVSAAALWRMREVLDAYGGAHVKIVASSGFGVEKCLAMHDARAPADIIGTGSYLPHKWDETYATADIVAYDGVLRVKSGREHLMARWQDFRKSK